MNKLTVPERHLLRVARDTLKMPDAMVHVMGGPSKADARKIIQRLTDKKFSERRVKRNSHRRRTVSRKSRRRIVVMRPKRRRRNPTLGILAANPRGPHIVKELSRRTYDVAYKHTEDGGPYKHSFGKGVHISLLSDGNVLLWHPTHSIWKRFA